MQLTKLYFIGGITLILANLSHSIIGQIAFCLLAILAFIADYFNSK